LRPAVCWGLPAIGLAAAAIFSSVLLAAPSWVILEGERPEEPSELIRVAKENRQTSQKGIVVLEEQDGKTRTVAGGRILAVIPALPEGEAKIEREEAVRAINLLLEAKNKAPSLEKPLQEQVEKWKELLDKMPNANDPEALARAEDAFARAVSAAIPGAYDPMEAYTPEQPEARISALEKLKKEFPARTAEIQQLLDPWEIELRNLREGRRKFEGRWLSSEEWERERGARESAAQEAFLKTIHPPDISPILIGQGTLLASLAAATVGIFFGISFLFHGILELMRRRAWWKGPAWILGGLLVVGLIGRGTGLALAHPEPLDTGSGGNASVLEELMWETVGQKKPFPRELQLRDMDLNEWCKKRLQPGALSLFEILVVKVEGWKIQFLDGGLILERAGRLLGYTVILRQELILQRNDKGEQIYRMEGSIGKMPLPPAVVFRSWSRWVEDVSRLAEFFSAPKGIRLEKFEKGRGTFSCP